MTIARQPSPTRGSWRPAISQGLTSMSTTHPSDGTGIELERAFDAQSVRSAPRTFEPGNTRQCPQMFSDKWAVTTGER